MVLSLHEGQELRESPEPERCGLEIFQNFWRKRILMLSALDSQLSAEFFRLSRAHLRIVGSNVGPSLAKAAAVASDDPTGPPPTGRCTRLSLGPHGGIDGFLRLRDHI
jgi:hypothetical protein